MTLTRFAHGITAIDTGVVRPGFDASHLLVSGGRAAFVDTGTAFSVPRLLSALEAQDVDPADVDFVLLTHVHLDHAGGAGALMRQLPNAVAVLHPRVAPHVVDPARLVAGSIAVYGEEAFRRMYGEITAIPETRVRTVGDGERITLGERELELVHTEGHARHHYCIIDHAARAIFSGDTFGVSYRDFDTVNGPFIFPTTTPVHFDPRAAHVSINRLMAYAPHAVLLTHYSRVGELQRLADDLHECIDAFVTLARECRSVSQPGARMRERMLAFLDERLVAHGYEGDSAQRRALLEPDVDLNVQGLEVWLSRTA